MGGAVRSSVRSMAIRTATVAIIASSWPLLAADAVDNRLENPGFEVSWTQEADGLIALHAGALEPTHWWPTRTDPGNAAVFKWDENTAFSGSRSVSVSTRRQDPAVPRYEAWNAFVGTEGLAGSTVTLRAMVRTENTDESARVEFRIHAFRGGIATGDPCGASARMPSNEPGWVEHSLSFVVPDGADQLVVQLGIHGRGTAWFDEVSLLVDEGAEPSASAWPVDLTDPRLIYVQDAAAVIRAPLTPPTRPLDEKPWTILMYAAADFHMAFTPLEIFASHVPSIAQANVLILEDYVGLEATIWFVDRHGLSACITPVLELGEAEMDEPEPLRQLLEFAEQWYPAKRTLLYFYGHGHGWWGACNDQSNDDAIEGPAPWDWLTPSEMRSAIEPVGGVDAVMFSAPCVMSSLEAAYELRGVTDLYVASEETSGYIFWWNAVAPIAGSLAGDPDQDAATLGEKAITTIRETVQARIDSGDPIVPRQPAIAATSTSELTHLAEALDAFSAALIAALPRHRAAISSARTAATDFAYGELVDLYAFAELCAGIPDLEEAAGAVLHAVGDAVIGMVSSSVDGGTAHGLSLYFPVTDEDAPDAVAGVTFDVAGEIYRDYGLSLLADTRWYAFLDAFFGTPTSP